MEFHSLLKELGPSEDSRARDYRPVADAAELRAWLAAAGDAAVAVALSRPAAEGELALGSPVSIGLAWRPGEARSVTADHLDTLKPWLEDPARPKIASDVKAATLELARLGVEARGFAHDVMLYAFLLDADPGGRFARKPGAAPPRSQARHRARAARRYHPGALPPTSPGDRPARTAQALRRNRAAADRRARRHGTAPASASTAPSCSASPA